METGAVEPDFGVFEREKYVVPREAFVLGRIAVGFETSLDRCAFVFGDEFCFGWPVGNEPESSNSEDDRLR